jgi:hypothetical protein
MHSVGRMQNFWTLNLAMHEVTIGLYRVNEGVITQNVRYTYDTGVWMETSSNKKFHISMLIQPQNHLGKPLCPMLYKYSLTDAPVVFYLPLSNTISAGIFQSSFNCRFLSGFVHRNSPHIFTVKWSELIFRLVMYSKTAKKQAMFTMWLRSTFEFVA